MIPDPQDARDLARDMDTTALYLGDARPQLTAALLTRAASMLRALAFTMEREASFQYLMQLSESERETLLKLFGKPEK